MLLSRLKKKRLLQLKVSRSSVSPLMAELLLSLLWYKMYFLKKWLIIL